MAAGVEETREDLAELMTVGIFTRQLSDLEGRRWRQRLAALAHRHGLAVITGTTNGQAWVALSGERTNYGRW
jgi:hypothetical protein